MTTAVTTAVTSTRTTAGPAHRWRPAGEAGTATPLVLGLAAVLTACGAVATALGAVAAARQQAASAADLSSLAAAAVVLHGPDAACARAGALAGQVGARITSCRVDGDRVEVVAEVRPPGALGRLGAASVRAAAGPVTAGPVAAGPVAGGSVAGGSG